MTAIASEIAQALAARLATVKTANGYTTDLKQVYADKIPMGLELVPEDLPCVFVLDDGAQMEHQHQQLDVARAYRLQIIDLEEVADDRIFQIIRDLAKAVYANSPTAAVQDQFRFHERVYWVQLDSDEGDLHMIDGNRIATVRMIVHYRTRPYDL